MKISEYDAFGPWIYKVDENHEIPKYFIPYVDESDGALFRLKVPKKIERRDATPDMDLYEYLINVYDNRIELMQIEEAGGIRMQKVPYDKICAVTVFRELLQGILTVYLGDDTFTFSYNAVSQDLIMEMVSVIRKGYQEDRGNTDLLAAAYDPLQLNLDDLFFINEWVRLEPAERPIIHSAYQPEKAIPNSEEHKVWGALHIKKDQEWILLTKLEAYSFEYLYLPRVASVNIDTKAGSRYEGVEKMKISSGNYSLEMYYSSDNKAIEAHYKD
ncbi:MAG: hypothetical protein IJT32_04165 [Lachnospiraceae bacterium]|nr:hypothetical protein [Lachnospiraceae bacterium]